MHTLKLGALYFPGAGVCYYTDANIQDTHDHFNITDYIDYYISYFICFLLLLRLRQMHQTQTHPHQKPTHKGGSGGSYMENSYF